MLNGELEHEIAKHACISISGSLESLLGKCCFFEFSKPCVGPKILHFQALFFVCLWFGHLKGYMHWKTLDAEQTYRGAVWKLLHPSSGLNEPLGGGENDQGELWK